MDTQSPASAAKRQLAAYNARDLEAFLAVYAEDCVVRSMPSQSVMMRGKAQMRERYGAMFAAHPALHAALTTRIEHGPFAIDHEEVVGLREGETVYAVAMYEVRDGIIVAVWFLQDPAITA